MDNSGIVGGTLSSPPTSLAVPKRPPTPTRKGVDEPATLLECGTIPAVQARKLVLGAGPETPVWLRRLDLRPGTGGLAAIDSSAVLHRRAAAVHPAA